MHSPTASYEEPVKMRPTANRLLMETAVIWSRRGTCNRRCVGAVLARDTRIVGTGYTGSPPYLPHCLDAGCILDAGGGCVRTQHAEANAIAFAARKGIATEDCDLYTTLSPCLPCAKLILAAGIAKVYFLEEYRDIAGIVYLRQKIECELLEI